MTNKNTLKRLSFSVIGILSSFNVNASLALSPTYPDLTSFSMNAAYTANCSGSDGSIALCGSSVTTGKGKKAITIDYNTFDTAQLVLSSSLLLLNVSGNDGIPVTTPGNWALTANFSDFGIVSTATLDSTGILSSGDHVTNFSSGSIVNSSNVTGFDFNGEDTSGILQFTFDSATGDLPTYTTDNEIGVIATINSVTPAVSGAWSTGSIWQQSFSSTGQADTFSLNPQIAPVPIPPSALLFASGIFGLLFRFRKN